MRQHRVQVYKSADTPPRAELLAWKIACVAADDAPVDPDVAAMIVNRVIDNAGVAVAGLARHPVANARAQALAHPHRGGATVFGMPRSERVACEWAAWANASAVRELDFHDTYLAADMNHPGDMIPAIVAVGQQCGASGGDVVRGIATAYEIDVCLANGICLHEHRIDHLTHIATGMVAGIGSMLRLPAEVLYQAVNHVVHVTITTRHTDRIIGTGSGDPQKFDPLATRETLDHSLMYIFAVALEDGTWHHVESYLPARAARASTIALWRRIRTVDDPEWTRRYHAEDPRQKAFGGRVVITLEDGVAIEDEIAVADAHPLGAQPFGREDYLAKFNTLSSEYAGAAERNRFLAAALALPALPQGALQELTVEVPPQARHYEGLRPGLFEQSSR